MSGAFYHILLQRERQLLPTAPHFHDAPLFEVPAHDFFRQGIFDVLLNDALQRPRPKGGVVALLGQPVLGLLIDLDRQSLLDQLLIEALDLNVDDLHDVIEAQRMEHQRLIYAVQELGVEHPLQLLLDVLPHFLHGARFAIALEAKGREGIPVFEAVDKQLGLKLELKDVPLPTLHIEKVNRKPTANAAGITTALALASARFEAATIKPADPNERPFQGLLYTGGSQMRAGGTLRFMIALSLQVPPNVAEDMVVGLPKSADSQRWDITAKVPTTGEGAPNVAGVVFEVLEQFVPRLGREVITEELQRARAIWERHHPVSRHVAA